MRVTICGPNLRDQSKGSFHVHAAGCAALVRGANHEPEYRHGWTIEAASTRDVTLAVYEDMIEDPNDDAAVSEYAADLHFFPCCADLD